MKSVIFFTRTIKIVFILFLLSYGQSILDNLAPGVWTEVPNSHLDAVKPNPLPKNQSGFGALISAWNGGAYDTKRDRLLVWGGGHGDYAGNEIYAFDVYALSWSRIWGPTPNAQIPEGGNFETYNDGNPSSRHTYDGLVYVPDPVDAFFAHGGSKWFIGYETRATWKFDFSSGQWERKADSPGSHLGMTSAYNSVNGKTYVRGLSRIMEYDVSGNSWKTIYNSNTAWYSDDVTSAIDTKRQIVVFIGNNQFQMYNLNTNQFSSPSTTGDNEILGGNAPGVVYDPVVDKIVAWSGQSGGRANVYALDMDTFTWTVNLPSEDNTVIPTSPAQGGTFGRFQYIPSLNAYILVNSVSQNVFLYKLSGKGPQNPRTPKNIKIEPAK